jgi:hypothetical protein
MTCQKELKRIFWYRQNLNNHFTIKNLILRNKKVFSNYRESTKQLCAFSPDVLGCIAAGALLKKQLRK